MVVEGEGKESLVEEIEESLLELTNAPPEPEWDESVSTLANVEKKVEWGVKEVLLVVHLISWLGMAGVAIYMRLTST